MRERGRMCARARVCEREGRGSVCVCATLCAYLYSVFNTRKPQAHASMFNSDQRGTVLTGEYLQPRGLEV
uniref:Uncharacterized protein n=1 Tax=Anguilla anguilla TaxID=7936 RepID=A0A0E9PLX9_ANGAN